MIAKHLCANATDLAVQAVQHAFKVAAEKGQNTKIASVVLAPCCHPQIQWDSYTNVEFLERHGFLPSELEAAALNPDPHPNLFTNL